MNIFKEYRSYFLAFVIFCACLITAPHVYSYWNIENVDPVKLYEMDKQKWEEENEYLRPLGYMSYNAWLIEQDEKRETCKKRRNCEQMESERRQEWLHWANEEKDRELKLWYQSDDAKKENN